MLLIQNILQVQLFHYKVNKLQHATQFRQTWSWSYNHSVQWHLITACSNAVKLQIALDTSGATIMTMMTGISINHHAILQSRHTDTSII